MTVKELRQKILGLPDDMPVLLSGETTIYPPKVVVSTAIYSKNRGWMKDDTRSADGKKHMVLEIS